MSGALRGDHRSSGRSAPPPAPSLRFSTGRRAGAAGSNGAGKGSAFSPPRGGRRLGRERGEAQGTGHWEGERRPRSWPLVCFCNESMWGPPFGLHHPQGAREPSWGWSETPSRLPEVLRDSGGMLWLLPGGGPPGPIRWENCMASLASGAWGAEPSGGGKRDPLGTSLRRERWASGNPSQDRCFGIKKLPSKRTGVPSNPFPNPSALRKEKVRSIKIAR